MAKRGSRIWGGAASGFAGKTLGVGVLKGHGFPAVRKSLENDVRRGWKPRPFKIPAADFDVFQQALQPYRFAAKITRA
jgi:hypothetical protein